MTLIPVTLHNEHRPEWHYSSQLNDFLQRLDRDPNTSERLKKHTNEVRKEELTVPFGVTSFLSDVWSGC
jgi:hypothetical protein